MEKLSNADRNRILARSLFVDANQSTSQISNTLNVSDKTIQNYQSKDKSLGFDWLTMRASKHIQSTQDTKENMYSMFTGYMMDSLKEIRENEKMTPEVKAQMIVSLGDSFSKMGKVARQEDPEAYKYGIIKITIKKILEALKKELDKDSMEKIIEIIYEIQEELADVTI
jgi:transposase